MAVIDVHTHMFSRPYLDLVQQKGAPKYTMGHNKGGQEAIFAYGAPYVTLFPEMCDYEARIKNMDKAGVDIAIVSLTAQNCYFGGPEVSLKAAQLVNDDMADQQSIYPDRIRWFASIPWQYPELALAELNRCVKAGAIGAYVAANIDGKNLTDPSFSRIWDRIDELSLPVLVHPTAPKGSEEMDLHEYGLVPPIGFMFDTTLAISRMVLDGFFEKYQKMKIIASHGGATLPYLAGRLDQCHANIPDCAEKISTKPSEYLREFVYYDSVVFTQEALQLCVDQMGEDRVLYGSDYPHNIGDMAGCLARVNQLKAPVRDKVRDGNVLRIFNI